MPPRATELTNANVPKRAHPVWESRLARDADDLNLRKKGHTQKKNRELLICFKPRRGGDGSHAGAVVAITLAVEGHLVPQPELETAQLFRPPNNSTTLTPETSRPLRLGPPDVSEPPLSEGSAQVTRTRSFRQRLWKAATRSFPGEGSFLGVTAQKRRHANASGFGDF